MSRDRVNPTSLPLFGGEKLTLERALVLAKKYPYRCGFKKKRGGGKALYWVARTPAAAGGRDVYVGSDETKRQIELAWELVRAELAQVEAEAAPAVRELERAADAIPAIRKLRELQTISGVRGGTWLYAGKGDDEVRMVAGGETRPPK